MENKNNTSSQKEYTFEEVEMVFFKNHKGNSQLGFVSHRPDAIFNMQYREHVKDALTQIQNYCKAKGLNTISFINDLKSEYRK